MPLVTSEDSLHRGREGAEAAADGSGRGDEEQRLSLHRPVLRRPLQRGQTELGFRSGCYHGGQLEKLPPLFQGDCWICMELMATSLDKFYKYVYCVLDDVIPEEILGKITLAVSTLLFSLNLIL